ncbi:MAG: hypothetical protein ACRC8M_00970 [Cetobacterium sp.]|uniref:hypothetical protein n=1 Tax=Cetobacterium sp. TaxID=2071632 RepID=UPI003F2DCE28
MTKKSLSVRINNLKTAFSGNEIEEVIIKKVHIISKNYDLMVISIGTNGSWKHFTKI